MKINVDMNCGYAKIELSSGQSSLRETRTESLGWRV